MKLKDLVEKKQITYTGDLFVPPGTTVLNYDGVTVKGSFNCSNSSLASLEGSPSYVGHSFYANNTTITSLHNIHKYVKYIGSLFYLPATIKSHVLGVMFIKGLMRGIEFDQITTDSSDGKVQERWQVKNIINKHLKGDRNVHDAQQELIEAGLKEFAKL